jgi:hypothetical protein
MEMRWIDFLILNSEKVWTFSAYVLNTVTSVYYRYIDHDQIFWWLVIFVGNSSRDKTGMWLRYTVHIRGQMGRGYSIAVN